MTNYAQMLTVLNELLRGTEIGHPTWTKDNRSPCEWYNASLGGEEISFRFLYFEATNRVGPVHTHSTYICQVLTGLLRAAPKDTIFFSKFT